MKIKRIVHATDFSRASRPALALALDLARAFEAELILCHAYQAVTPMGAGEAYVSPQLLQQMWTAAEQGARRNLARLERSTQGSRVRTKTLLVDGPAADAIVRAAQRKRADLLVVGTHGRTGVRRLLIGSVAERVVRTAMCPVVTVAARRTRTR